MGFSIGNLISSVEGAFTSAVNAAENFVDSAISDISGGFESVCNSVESAVSGAMAAVGVVDVNDNGELDMDDAEEFLEEKFKLLVGASIQGVENLALHPIDTAFATAGIALGVIGVAGSGVAEFFTGGTASPLAIPVAAFSANSVMSSAADLEDIASGNYKQEGSFNPIKSGAEFVGGTIGIGIDKIAKKFNVNDTNVEEAGKNAGAFAFGVTDLFFGAKGVKDGAKKIVDNSYKIKEITSIGDKIIPTISVPVNNISNAEKIGAVADISNTVGNWVNKVKSKITGDDKK